MASDLQQQVDQLRAEVAALQRRRSRRLDWRRRLPLGIVALLVALVPLSLLAAEPFNDLNAGSVHNPNIQAIADAGITRGCDPGVSYCPNGLVTREEMASFLARTAGIGGNTPVVNAKTAQTATNAQQLGGQPASAYQLAGQPVPQATNAITVGGYAPGGLAYAAGRDLNSNLQSPPSNSDYSQLTDITIEAPGPGYVVVIGTVNIIAASTDPGQSVALVRLCDIRFFCAIATEPLKATVGNTAGSATNMTVSPVNLFIVEAAGTYTFQLQMRYTGTMPLTASRNPLVGYFSPFGRVLPNVP